MFLLAAQDPEECSPTDPWRWDQQLFLKDRKLLKGEHSKQLDAELPFDQNRAHSSAKGHPTKLSLNDERP